ncbi:amino acid permease [Candidatus Nomurabacteria bacterium]|nr:amino acid permease [Candidatus Nomurabacteria bacterium]
MVKSKQKLRRRLSLNLLVLYGLGNILGAGIYVLVGEVANRAGSFLPVSFVLANLVAALSAYSFAKLSSAYPTSGGEAAYVQAAFKNKLLPLVTGLGIALSGIISSATLSKGFIGYFHQFIPDLSPVVILFGLIGLMAIFATNQVDRAIKIAGAMTWLEIIGLIGVIIFGTLYIKSNQKPLDINLNPNDIIGNLGIIISGSFIAFYAYLGFEDMSNVAEEVKSPEKNMPRGIYISLIIAGIVYLLVGIIAQTTLGTEALAKTNAPLSDVFKLATGVDFNILGLIGLAAITNGVLIQIIMVSRLIYGVNRDHPWMGFSLLQKLNRNNVPARITLASAIIIFILTNLFDLSTLASITSTILLAIFGLVNLSLIKLSLDKKLPLGKSIWIPILALIANAILIFFSLH